MSYKISSTEVITDGGALVNIVGASGVYSNFRPTATSITSAINFDTPMMTLTMSGNVTFSESNKAAGKYAILLLDRSSNSHTPTFSSNIKWKDGTTPTWSGYRYWQIVFESIDTTLVRASAIGFAATGGSFTPTTDTYTTGSNVTITSPTGATSVTIRVWGGGGGGNELRGGGGSGYSRKTATITGGTTQITYTVGAGGAGSTGGTGGTGGTSTAEIVGASVTLTATGGQGAPRSSNANGGTASGGDVNEASAGGATTISGGQAGDTESLANGGGGVQYGSNAVGNSFGGGGGYGGTGSTGATGAVRLEWS